MSLTMEERAAGALYRKAKARERKEANKANNARKPAEKRHRGREINTGYLQFVRRQPCLVCLSCAPNDAAHIRMASPERGKFPTGMQVKPSDRFAVPLCRTCHTVQHSMSEAGFWREKGIDPFDAADRLFADYNSPVPALGGYGAKRSELK